MAVVLEDGNIIFGSEESNYAGGTTLTPLHNNYELKKNEYFKEIKRNDSEFYDLIIETLND